MAEYWEKEIEEHPLAEAYAEEEKIKSWYSAITKKVEPELPKAKNMLKQKYPNGMTPANLADEINRLAADYTGAPQDIEGDIIENNGGESLDFLVNYADNTEDILKSAIAIQLYDSIVKYQFIEPAKMYKKEEIEELKRDIADEKEEEMLDSLDEKEDMEIGAALDKEAKELAETHEEQPQKQQEEKPAFLPRIKKPKIFGREEEVGPTR